MKTINAFIFHFTFSLSLLLNSQTKTSIVQTKTVTFHGATDTCDYFPILINSNNNVIVAGNNKVSSTQYDAIMVAQTSNALSVWNNSFNLSNQKAFIVASANDNAGNIITVGGIRTASTNALDWLVIKQNSGGSILWVYTYDGPGQYNDCATAVTLDSGNNIFVTGASDGTLTSLADYATMMLNPSGSQQWLQRYNYGDNFDIPTAINYNNVSNNVTVIGSSGTTLGNYEIATVVYDASSGTQLSSNRVSNTAGSSQDKPFGLVTDSLGNSIVVGTSFNGNNYDAYLAKLDTNLSVVWQHTIDFNGFDDSFFSVDIDDSLNVYVGGKSYISNTEHELKVLKFYANGNFAWAAKTQRNPSTNSEAVKIHVKSNDEIFVGGNIINGVNQDLIVLRLDNTGDVNLEKTFNGPANAKDQFMDFEITSSNIYVSARTYSVGLDYNIVVNFEYRDHIINPATNTVSGGNYSDNELILGFHKSCLKMNNINNKDKLFGLLSNFVADSTCNRISMAIDPSGSLQIAASEWKAQKIFFDLTEADSLSITRLGDTIKVPMFYTRLLVTIPSTLNTISISNSISAVYPDVYSSSLNYLYSLNTPTYIPSDPHYSLNQSSLHPTNTYSLAHINCEPAWDYTKGHKFVRIGIYDTGVSSTHPDLANNIGSHRNYTGSMMGTTDIDGHGTMVAGVIGAKSNNALGVAGIMGGDAAATGTHNTGGVISSMKVFEPLGGGLATSVVLANAYTDGANGFFTANGNMLHIMNHSYGSVSVTTDPIIEDAIDYVNQNGVAFIAARGNKSNLYQHPWNVTEYSSPATLKPGKVMNVGANGTNGHYHLENINGTIYSSMYDHNVDFIAPGAYANVRTTKTDVDPRVPLITSQTPTYTTFGGTSSSAPHVSGVTGLMMSYRNLSTPNWDNLVHEDCEAILKRTAIDQSLSVTYSETVNYDIRTGYGKIDAGGALAALEPQYKIRHINNFHYSPNFTSNTSTISNGTWYWPGAPTTTIPAGNYDMDMVQVTINHNYSSLFSNETYLGAWPLYKASNAMGPILGGATVIPTHEQNYVELTIPASTSTAQVKGYTYHLTRFYTGNSSYTVDLWVPQHPSLINLGLTLYSLDNNPVYNKELQASIDYFNLYPNPNKGQFILGFNSRIFTKANVNVVDITGRLVYAIENKEVQLGINRFDIKLNHLPKGIYFVNLDIETNKSLVKKVIIE